MSSMWLLMCEVNFVDLSELPTDLAKEHGLDSVLRTWLESKMAQHLPIAFNMCRGTIASQTCKTMQETPSYPLPRRNAQHWCCRE